jgi:hypothetical protein
MAFAALAESPGGQRPSARNGRAVAVARKNQKNAIKIVT